ncbi:MAG: HAD family phosphatase [Muribaculaceae bacterium]|nr:HAD family phosphatase [Muribaculaceae bacterium]
MFPAAALFDLDGVLIDTEPEYTRIWDNIVLVHPTGIDNFALKIKGTTLPKILETYFPDTDIQHDVVRMIKEGEAAMAYPIFDGTEAFLQDLKDRGIPSAIVTSSGPVKMGRLFKALPGFRDYFDVVITDADISHSKPHPECYLTAAQRLGVDPKDCVVFEDSFAGLQSGSNAGATVVALATTNPAESLRDKADLVINNLSGLTVDSLICQLKNTI